MEISKGKFITCIAFASLISFSFGIGLWFPTAMIIPIIALMFGFVCGIGYVIENWEKYRLCNLYRWRTID